MTLAPTIAATVPAPQSEAPVRADAEKGAASDHKQVEHHVAEFFAGIGLARLGLESADAGFKVTWANDLDSDKHSMYMHHFGESERAHYHVGDIRKVAGDLQSAAVPRDLSLAWASFPCTDLSLAGGREGLAGVHSGTFWDFTDVLERLGDDRPPVVAIENVNGFATSHGGEDIKAAIRRLNELGYSVDVLTLDARRWVPQSRPRLFLVASAKVPVMQDENSDTEIRPAWLDGVLNDGTLRTHRALLDMPPKLLSTGWTDLVDPDTAADVAWWDEPRTAKFELELSPVQKKRLEVLTQGAARRPLYRTAYRRTRKGTPAWEIRADDVAGCLRTARGGSSKQAVVRIQRDEPLRVRWMTPREYAKLMGAPGYTLPARNSLSIMGFGDAVCVDAVRWLAKNYLQPLLSEEPHRLSPDSLTPRKDLPARGREADAS